MEERVVARQGPPIDPRWALGPLTLDQLEEFCTEVRAAEAEGWNAGILVGTVRFTTGFTNIKTTCTRGAADGTPDNRG